MYPPTELRDDMPFTAVAFASLWHTQFALLCSQSTMKIPAMAKSPFTQKCVLLIISSLGCMSVSVLYVARTEFEAENQILFSKECTFLLKPFEVQHVT